ncbi:MAG: hypothetical protein U0166_03755 [Acidobacteriota bacterium]
MTVDVTPWTIEDVALHSRCRYHRGVRWHAALPIVALASMASAYTLVTKDGRKMEIASAPSYEGGKARFTLPGGGQASLPEADVDRAATEKANAAPAAGKNAFTNADLPAHDGSAAPEPPPSMPEPVAPPPSEAGSDPSPPPPAERPDRTEQRIEELRKRVEGLRNEHEEMLRGFLADGVMDSSEMSQESRAREAIAGAERELADARR